VSLAGRDATAEFGFGNDMVLFSALFLLIRSLILPWTALAAGNLALRQHLAVLNKNKGDENDSHKIGSVGKWVKCD
jgi:hypothetical protein